MTLWLRGLARSRDKLKPLYVQYHSAYDHQSWYNRGLPWETLNQTALKHFDHVFLKDHVTNESHYIFTTTVSMATKIERMVTYLDGLLWSCQITWHSFSLSRPRGCKMEKQISTTTILMATKLGKVITYHEELPLKTLYDPSVKWFCEVTWHSKHFISPFTLDQWSPNMGK